MVTDRLCEPVRGRNTAGIGWMQYATVCVTEM